MRKTEYVIIINNGKRCKSPLIYTFGRTKGIELHISRNSICIGFSQSRKEKNIDVRNDSLCSDAIKKAFLIHLLKFESSVDVAQVSISVDGIRNEIYDKSKSESPFVYSMVEGRITKFSKDRNKVFDTILEITKSQNDSRMNAVFSLLIAKSKLYQSEKAMYLWMAMNGFYNFLASQCMMLSGKNKNWSESKKQNLLCSVINERYSSKKRWKIR